MLMHRSTPIRQQQQPLHHGQPRVHLQVRAAAAAKGFGDPAKAALAPKCPCGSKLTYKECCEPMHLGKAIPTTGEAALRSRFAAFSKGEVDYLVATDLREISTQDQRKRDYASDVNSRSYTGLKILQVEAIVSDAAETPPTQCIKFQYNYSQQERKSNKPGKQKQPAGEQSERQMDGSMKVHTTVERSKFIKCTSGAWGLGDSELIETPAEEPAKE